MKYHSEKNLLPDSVCCRAFSLVETVTALVILAMVSSGVFAVINRCMTSTAQMTLRMEAFEVARDNMEKILTTEVVTEKIEYGTSDKYPEIKWQTVVGPFYEPVTSKMWIGATSLAEYPDVNGQPQTIELTHWLTNLTEKQIKQIKDEREEQEQEFAELLIETLEEAAEYAGVDEETIGEWVENGMQKTPGGKYIKEWLDLYAEAGGNPTDEEKAELMELAQIMGLFDNSGKIGQTPGTDTTLPLDTDSGESGGDEFKWPKDMDPGLRKLLEGLLKER